MKNSLTNWVKLAGDIMGDPLEISNIRREVSDRAYANSNHLP